MLLPSHIQYEDEPHVDFDFRLNGLTMAGGVLHSPTTEDGTLLPALVQPTPDGYRYKSEYFNRGKRIVGPRGFAAEISNSDELVMGYHLDETGGLNLKEGVQDKMEIKRIQLQHQMKQATPQKLYFS